MFCCLYFIYKLFFEKSKIQEKEIPLLEIPKEISLKISPENTLDSEINPKDFKQLPMHIHWHDNKVKKSDYFI
jgi:hypothetical protein